MSSVGFPPDILRRVRVIFYSPGNVQITRKSLCIAGILPLNSLKQSKIRSAISVPIYLNQRKSAWNSQTESDVKNASLVMETIMTNNNGKVPTLKASSCTGSSTNSKCDIYDGNEVTVSDGVTIVITATAGAGTYTVEGTNSNNTGCKNYVYNSANGSVSSTDHKDLVAKQD